MAERYNHLNQAYKEILNYERLKNLTRIAKYIENSTVGIFETTLDERVRAASISFCELLGYSSSKMHNMHYQTFCHPADLSAYYFLKERLLSGELEQCYLNMRYLREDGQILQVLQSTYLNIPEDHDIKQYSGHDLYFIHHFEDITNWEVSSQTIEKGENSTHYLFEHNPNPMWIYDLETLDFLAVNQAAVKHYGYSEAEFLTMNLQDIRHAEDIPRLLESIAKITDGLGITEIWKHLKKDGSLILVEISSHTLVYKQRRCELVLVNDITQQIRAEESLKRAEEKYRSIFENAVEGIFQTSRDGKFLIANSMLAKIYGYNSPAELVQELTDIANQLYVDPHKREELVQLLLHQRDVKQFEAQVYRKNKEVIWTSENVHAVYDIAGNLLYFEGTVEDITESKRVKARIEHLAFHDSLTDLPNRLLFRDHLNAALQEANQHLQVYLQKQNIDSESVNWQNVPPLLAVLFLDLDRFKLVNDTMGHAVGDQLLIEVAKRLDECMIEETFLARMGGDEFMVFVPNLQSVESVQQFAQLILQSFEMPFVVDQQEIYIGTTIGISLFPIDGTDDHTLMKHADTAMFRAKERGRNSYQLYNHEIGAQVKHYVAIENAIRQALERSEFHVFYQPQLNLITGKIDCMEALTRWHHPELGWVSPSQFIPAAEEHGLIVRLGEWVLRTACQQVRSWQKAGLPPVRVAVNFSPQQFQGSNLRDRIVQILQEIELEPQYLEVEITESLVMQDKEMTIHTLRQLQSLGMTISIDDFGTGYSSLSYLRLLPASKVKIDASFIRDTPQNADDSAITSAIIAMAHNLNLRAIAEGVERQDQLDFLRSHNCDAIQGYFFSRPVPAQDAGKLLKEFGKYD